MNLVIEVPFNEKNKEFGLIVRVNLPHGQIVEHEYDTWELVEYLESKAYGFVYHHYLLRNIIDGDREFYIGTEPSQAKYQLVQYYRKTIRKFVASIVR